MKKNFKKIISASLLILAISAPAKSENFTDVSYSFDFEKNQAAEDSFHFLRSYVDYFYLLVNQNKTKLTAFNTLTSVSGWCVGDAHAENFGALIQMDQSAVFTINDMDDFGPCPVALDLYRLMVSSKLYDKNIQVDSIISNYLSGLKNKAVAQPISVKKIMDKSIKKGLAVSAKKIASNKIVRDSAMTEVSASEEQQILMALNQKDLGLSKNYKIIDLVSTRKIGGGSGGLLRYEVLILDLDKLIHLELKEEIKPSIYPVATTILPMLSVRIQKAIAIEQGTMASKLYSSTKIDERQMLIRPRFAGNNGVTLAGNSKSENFDIIYYEAYILGLIHAKSIENLDNYKKTIKSIPSKDFEFDVQSMIAIFETKFREIKK